MAPPDSFHILNKICNKPYLTGFCNLFSLLNILLNIMLWLKRNNNNKIKVSTKEGKNQGMTTKISRSDFNLNMRSIKTIFYGFSLRERGWFKDVCIENYLKSLTLIEAVIY